MWEGGKGGGGMDLLVLVGEKLVDVLEGDVVCRAAFGWHVGGVGE